jgi:prepilin signal peptidase PulO-like enzyme (type II secretory pathway)
MIILVLVLLGLVWGSFVNAFVWRLHEGKDWVRGRSECTVCRHPLASKDLVPVFSWLSLRGKCRYCRKPIKDNPLVELCMPLLFVVSYAWWPWVLQGAGLLRFVFWIVFLIGFVILAVYDFRWKLLPDKVVFPFVGLAVLQVSGGRWIGGGDVKLGLMLGILCGGAWQALLLLFVASLAGTLVTTPLLLNKKLKAKATIPFGPFLLLAIFIIVLFGTAIIDWYTSLIV